MTKEKVFGSGSPSLKGKLIGKKNFIIKTTLGKRRFQIRILIIQFDWFKRTEGKRLMHSSQQQEDSPVN